MKIQALAVLLLDASGTPDAESETQQPFEGFNLSLARDVNCIPANPWILILQCLGMFRAGGVRARPNAPR